MGFKKLGAEVIVRYDEYDDIDILDALQGKIVSKGLQPNKIYRADLVVRFIKGSPNENRIRKRVEQLKQLYS